jgi:hypothetical protein
MRLLKKILKWIGIVVVGLVAIALIASALFIWITGSRLERQVAAIRATGDPVTIADLARPPIPPEKNAATYLDRARADMQAIEKEVEDVHSATTCPGYLLPPKDQKAIKAAFAAYPNVLPLLEQAAACPDYDPELDYTAPAGQFIQQMLLLSSRTRPPARILGYRADLLVAEGKQDEAVRTSLLTLRLARHFDRNPTIVGYLMALAIRGSAIERANEALQTGPVSKEVRNALDAELAVHERMEGLKWAMKSERAYSLSSGLSQVELFGGLRFLGRGMVNMWMSDYLYLVGPYVSAADDPATFPGKARAIALPKSQSFPAVLVQPAIIAYNDAVTRMQALIRCLHVLNALQAHATPDGDAVPQLSSLGLPVATTTDPFNGKPLNVKKTPQGWLVYSVGPNLVDDGGKLDSPQTGDIGVGPPPAEAAK